MLANRPLLEGAMIGAVAAVWVDELAREGTPPELWEKLFAYTGRARSSALKAFPVTLDQVIDTWLKVSDGYIWNNSAEEWEPCRFPQKYCGKCESGFIQPGPDDSFPRYVKRCSCVEDIETYRWRRTVAILSGFTSALIESLPTWRRALLGLR